MWIYWVTGIFIPSIFFIFGYVLRATMGGQSRARGTITRTENEEGTTLYLFNIDGDPDEVIATTNQILFDVVR